MMKQKRTTRSIREEFKVMSMDDKHPLFPIRKQYYSYENPTDSERALDDAEYNKQLDEYVDWLWRQ